MIVIALEGCHACGKTEMCKYLEKQGYSVLDEAFLDMPTYGMHPQSLLMETNWVCGWFQRVLAKAEQLKESGNDEEGVVDAAKNSNAHVLVADRSPFSAVFYTANGHGKLLEPIVRQQMKELRESSGVEIYTVFMSVDKEVLWSRIQRRLLREPRRALYKEDKHNWMETVYNFYEGFRWDLTIDNSSEVFSCFEAFHDQLVNKVGSQSPQFKEYAKKSKKRLKECSRSESNFSGHSNSNSDNDSLASSSPSSSVGSNNSPQPALMQSQSLSCSSPMIRPAFTLYPGNQSTV